MKMPKKIIISTLALLMIAGGAIPSLAQYGGNYTFRSTVFGTNVRQTSNIAYEITDQRSTFNTNDNVSVLTRIFAISGMDSFQFKHDLIKDGNFYKSYYSQVYTPRGSWWAETYSVVGLGNLPTGNYNVYTYITVNGGGASQISTNQITVNNYGYDYGNNGYGYDNGYYNNNYGYNNYGYGCNNYDNGYYGNYGYNNGYCYNYNPTSKYSYNWTHTGTGLSGNDVTNGKTDFLPNENVYAVSRISNIQYIDKFRVKQELYLYGNQLFRTSESPEQNPNGSYVSEYNLRANFGVLPRGYHEIRIYLSINGGRYTIIDRKSISSGQTYNSYQANRYQRPYDRQEFRNRPNQNYGRRMQYNYSNTQLGNSVTYLSNNNYQISNPKTSFSTNENVAALTKISGIRYMGSYQVKYELYRDSVYQRYLESDIKYLNNASYDSSYTSADFGRLSAGNYTIKIYIRINNGNYQYLDQKTLSVTDYNYNYNYNNNIYYSNPSYNNSYYNNRYGYNYRQNYNYNNYQNYNYRNFTPGYSSGSYYYPRGY